MDIEYYLNDKESGKAYFKHFSTECAAWVQIIHNHKDAIAREKGVLKLIYQPSGNKVIPLYTGESPLVSMIIEDVMTLQTPDDMSYTKRLRAIEDIISQ